MYNSRLRSHTQSFGNVIQHKQLNPRIKRSNSSLLDHQLLRLKVCEKQDQIRAIFNRNQKQLCDFFINEYKPQSQSRINLKKVLNQRTDEIRLIKNANKIYFGGVDKRHKRVGDGILIDDKGKIYEGTFSDNIKQGFGLQIYPNGNVYIGHFDNNKKHGTGMFYWFTLSPPIKESALYVQFYSGAWWGGLPDGKGSHQKNSGDIYDGEFKNGLKHGQGQQYFVNGDSYKGEYINGLPEGFGLYIWQDSSKYQGDFKQGLRNGCGIWISGDRNEEYKGQYILDKKSGYGEYSWDKKSFLYKGHFENDLRHGYGQLYHYDQIQYKGQWSYGQIGEEANNSRNSWSKSKVNENSFVKTPKSQKFPSLSRLKPPASAIIKRLNNNQLKKQRILSRSRSPTYNNKKSRSPQLSTHAQGLHSIKKTFTLSKPIKLKSPTILMRNRSAQKTLKKRPLSYNSKKNSMNSKPQYELLVKKCDKKNCGCNVSIPLHTKSAQRKKKKSPIHFKTEDFCF